MTRIVIDPVMFSKLNGLAEPLELCDTAGKVLARVLPNEDANDYEPREPQVSVEELNRRSELRAKGFSTQEVLRRLDAR